MGYRDIIIWGHSLLFFFVRPSLSIHSVISQYYSIRRICAHATHRETEFQSAPQLTEDEFTSDVDDGIRVFGVLIDRKMVSVHLPENGFPADQNDVGLTTKNGVAFVNSNGDQLIARRNTNSDISTTAKYYYEIRWLRQPVADGVVNDESVNCVRFRVGSSMFS